MVDDLAKRRSISRSDLMSLDVYRAIRKEKRAELVAKKRNRRMEVGPVATFHFENFETMWLQIQEMLYIEKGGEAQIDDELRAFAPLIPNGRELVATVMFEIDDPLRRARVLGNLGGVEHKAFIRVGGEIVRGVPEEDQERTRDDGKASSVQFIRFPFNATQVAAFKGGAGDVVVGFDHPNYGHMAVMPAAVRAALGEDFA